MGSEPAHFLVVEDDAVIQRAIARGTRDLLEARFAATGAAALQALEGAELPRFILLDHGLPDVDGLEVLRRLRERPRCQGIPVVMFSSLQDPARTRLALAAGASEWVAKPDDPVGLRLRVRAICRRWAGAAAAPGAGPQPT